MATEPAAGGYDRLIRLLERAVPVAARLAGPVGVLAVVGLVAGAILWAVIADGVLPASAGAVLGLVVLLLVLWIPAGLLALLLSSLREVVGLPDRLRALPEAIRDHGGQLAGIAQSMRSPPRGRLGGTIRSAWQLFRLFGSAAEAVGAPLPLARLAVVPFLVACLVAALVVPLEAAAAVLALALDAVID